MAGTHARLSELLCVDHGLSSQGFLEGTQSGSVRQGEDSTLDVDPCCQLERQHLMARACEVSEVDAAFGRPC